MLRLVGRRAAHYRRLHAVSLFGLVVAIALVVAVPVFAEAIATEQLRHELVSPASEGSIPRAAVLLVYAPSRTSQPLPTSRYRQVGEWIAGQTPLAVGLPVSQAARAAQSEQLGLVVKPDGSGGRATDVQHYGTVAFLEGIEQHARILEGRWPEARRGSDGALEAVISTEGVDELGIRVGSTIQAVGQDGSRPVTIPVRVVGRWQATDAGESSDAGVDRADTQAGRADAQVSPYWFNRPDTYRMALLVPEAAFFDGLLTALPRAGREFTWYYAFDPSKVRAGQVDRIVAGLAEFRVAVGGQLRGLRLDAAPDDLLESYQRKVFFLQVFLFVLSAPVLAIVLAFIAASSSTVVDRQRAEIAILKSRGATTFQVAGIYLAEAVGLAAVATLVGTPLGLLLAVALGQIRGFLSLGTGGVIPARLGPEVYPYAIAAAALAVLSALLPALVAAGHSIVTIKQEAARELRPPFWRRYFLDLLPLPLAAYAYYLILQRQTVLPVGEAGDVFADPLLLVAPALAVFAIALPFLRIFPWLLIGLDRAFSPFLGVGPLVALRQIARQPASYVGLLLLLILTVALGTFAAGVAATVDRNYDDAAAYRVGADLRLGETGALDAEATEWTFLPVGEHLSAPGVVGAARVFRTSAKAKLDTRTADIQLLGVDGPEVAGVAHWRRDYADQPLGKLGELLAADEMNVLVSRNLFESQRLQIGDQINLTVREVPVEFAVAGVVEYFPTLYPDSDRFVIANVDYVFDFLGALPHDVWLRLAPGADPAAVVDDLKAREFPIVRDESLASAVAARRADVTRRGAFAMLSVGFLIAAGLTMLSILLHSYLSFRRRLQQIGILRAIGLSVGQLVSLFLAEQAIVVVSGVVAGTALGLGAGRLFIPFLQIKAEQHAGIPPFVAVSALGDVFRLYLLLGFFLAIVLPISLTLLRRVRIHEAIKFGEETG